MKRRSYIRDVICVDRRCGLTRWLTEISQHASKRILTAALNTACSTWHCAYNLIWSPKPNGSSLFKFRDVWQNLILFFLWCPVLSLYKRDFLIHFPSYQVLATFQLHACLSNLQATVLLSRELWEPEKKQKKTTVAINCPSAPSQIKNIRRHHPNIFPLPWMHSTFLCHTTTVREREWEGAVRGAEMRAQHVVWCVTMATAVSIPKITIYTHTQ